MVRHNISNSLLQRTNKCPNFSLVLSTIVNKLWSSNKYDVARQLTPKVLLSPVGTIWTSGRLVQFQFMLRFFEIFMEDVVFYKLRMHIIFSKIGHSNKKL